MSIGQVWDSLTLGPRRRRRQMLRRLAALDRADRSGVAFAPSGDWAGPETTSASPLRLFTVLALIVALVVGAVVALRRINPPVPAAAPASRPSSTPTRTSSGNGDSPPSGVEESSTRLRAIVAAPAGSGGFELTRRNPDGTPVTYDPCRPIHYVIRDRNTPPGGDRLVREAIAAVSEATGLVFVDDGQTDEPPGEKRAPFQPQRYGQRWAPVLIAWSSPTELGELAGATTGVGGSAYVTRTSSEFPTVTGYVSGSVTLDAPQLRDIARVGGDAGVRAVVEHELGHVVGLDHVGDRTQIMYPESDLQVTSYQSGDRRGLAALGAGACRPEL